MTDEQIERCTALYLANPRFAARGISFEAFAANPNYFLFGPGGHVFYLLSAKELVRVREAGGVRFVSNGRVVEKLRHHRYPRSRRAYISAKAAT